MPFPLTQANSAFHPSGVGEWVPASTGKAKACMVHSISGWTRGVQVKLWDSLGTCAIFERLRGVITTRRYTNPRLHFYLLPEGLSTMGWREREPVDLCCCIILSCCGNGRPREPTDTHWRVYKSFVACWPHCIMSVSKLYSFIKYTEIAKSAVNC